MSLLFGFNTFVEIDRAYPQPKPEQPLAML